MAANAFLAMFLPQRPQVAAAALPSDMLPLDHPAYVTTVRPGWRGYTTWVSATTALLATDGARLLKRFLPSATREWHEMQGVMHAQAAVRHRLSWSTVADEAAVATFGRKFEITDYRISGCACEEFSPQHKTALRDHALATSRHHRLAIRHYMAAGLCQERAIRRCQQQGL